MKTFGNMKALWLWYNFWYSCKNQYGSGIARIIGDTFSTDCNGIIKMFGYTHNDPSLVPGLNGNCPNYKEGIVLDEWIGAWYSKASKKGDINTLPTSGYWLVYIDKTAAHPGAFNHVGIYCAETGETFEMCIYGIRKQKLDRTYWNKWSDLYWCPQYTLPAAASKGDELLHVQCGSFEVVANAKRRMNELKAKGFDVQAKRAVVDGKTMHRLQTGAYSERKNAENMLARLKAAGYTDAYITTEGGTDEIL